MPVTIIQIVSWFHHYLIPWEVISWYYGGVPMQLTQGLLRGNPNVTQPIPILFRSPISIIMVIIIVIHVFLIILFSTYPLSSSPLTKRFHDKLNSKDTLCNLFIPIRGAEVLGKVGTFFQPGGHLVSPTSFQFFFKTNSLRSIHKCDETHTI